MLTVNIDLQDNLVNGQLGTIEHISIDTKCNVTKMYIKLGDSKAGLRKTNKDAFAKKHCWFPTEKTEADIPMKSTKTSSPMIKRRQFSLILELVCIVHKVQGLSLTKIVVSFHLLKQRNFN